MTMKSLTVVLVLGGCIGGANSPPTAEVSDSAGIRIVAYDLTREVLPTYRIVAEHDLEIGTRDGALEYTFSRIPSLAVMQDGSIVVSDAVAQELRVYAANGTYVRTLGRRGEGPGEFAAPPMIADIAADTVFAFDSRSARLTLISLDGELVGEVPLRSEGLGRVEAVIRRDDGTYVMQSPWIPSDGGPTESHEMRAELDSVAVLRTDAGGALIDTMRVMPDRTRARSMEIRTGGIVRVLQGPTPYSARAFVRSGGQHLLVARSDAVDLTLSGPAGEDRTIIRVLGVQNPATAEEILAHQQAALQESVGDGEIDPIVRLMNTAFLPDRLPAFNNVLLDDDGGVWVSLNELDASAGYDWIVLTREGEVLGTVHTPPDFQVHHVGRDFLVGVVTDELDVPYVRRYPLIAASDAEP
jgi:hypothetical protein